MHVTSTEEQDAVLSELDDLDAIKALVPLTNDGPKTADEQKLYELFTGLSAAPTSGGSLNDIDGGVPATPQKNLEQLNASEPGVTDSTPTYRDVMTSLYEFGSGRVVTLTLSCLAASLALGCLLGLLYVKYLLSGTAHLLGIPSDVTSRIESPESIDGSTDDSPSDQDYGEEKLGLLFLDVEAPQHGTILISTENDVFNEKHELVDYAFSDEEFLNDVDEKFHDAEPFASPLARSGSLSIPRIEIEYADPDLLPLPCSNATTPYSTPPHTPPRTLRRIPSNLSVRDSPSSPLTKPAWSLRASDAPALGLSSSPSSPLVQMRAVSPEPASIPGAFVLDEQSALSPERSTPRRAYRAPMPELDIAFAMQLRPGLGLGSDPAWLVRFLMAMFGWMTVLIGSTNGTRRVNQRAITA